METRTIGSLRVSLVGIGCNNFARKIDLETSTAVVDAALEHGITFFDTADRYGYGDHDFSGHGQSEVFLGKALGSRREHVIVATKFGNQMGDDPRNHGGNRRWVRMACENSLRRLGTDYIDLYQIHRPDADTPVAETLAALTELVQEGKVREVGCSNFTGPQIEEATQAAAAGESVRFESVQNEYSLLCREPEADGSLDACAEHGIGFLPYFPLASGLLTGKYTRGEAPPGDSRLAFWKAPRPHFDLQAADFETIERLTAFAAERGHTLLELAFAWLAAHPVVSSVIAGATSPDQVVGNAATVGWKLTGEERAEVDEISAVSKV